MLFSYTEVIHNSLLVRAAGMGGGAQGLQPGAGAGQRLRPGAVPAFLAWAFMLPGQDRLGLGPEGAAVRPQPAAHETGAARRADVGRAAARRHDPALRCSPRTRRAPASVLTRAFADGARTLLAMVAAMRNYRDAAIFLVARMFYVDGMTAVLIFIGIYATGVMHWGALEMLFYRHHPDRPGGAGRLRLARLFDAPAGAQAGGADRDPACRCSASSPFWAWRPTASFSSGITIGARTRRSGTDPSSAPCRSGSSPLIGFSNAVFITAHYASSRTLLTRLTPPDQTGRLLRRLCAIRHGHGWLAPLDGQHRHPPFQNPAGRLRHDHRPAGGRASSGCCSCARATATSALSPDDWRPSDDRGLLLGDGLFETLLWSRRRAGAGRGPRRADDRRLRRSSACRRRQGAFMSRAGRCARGRPDRRPRRGAADPDRRLRRPRPRPPRRPGRALFATAAPSPRPATPAASRSSVAPQPGLAREPAEDAGLPRQRAGPARGASRRRRRGGDAEYPDHVACAAAANLFWMRAARCSRRRRIAGSWTVSWLGRSRRGPRGDGSRLREVHDRSSRSRRPERVFLTSSLIGLRPAHLGGDPAAR